LLGYRPSNVVEVNANDQGGRDFLVRPNSALLQEQAEQMFKPRYAALEIVEGDDTGAAGLTLRDVMRSQPTSVFNPARTSISRTVRAGAMLLGLAGLIVSIVAHSIVGRLLLLTGAIILIWQSVSYLRQRRTTNT
jgi:hypothetical protein